MSNGVMIKAETGAWTFGNGANTFDEHAIKSIPGYLAGHDIITKLSDYFVGSGSFYDIGCSTGTLLSSYQIVINIRAMLIGLASN